MDVYCLSGYYSVFVFQGFISVINRLNQNSISLSRLKLQSKRENNEFAVKFLNLTRAFMNKFADKLS